MTFDADTGRLDVVPATPAATTKVRWSPKLAAAANAQVPGAAVRTVHVLAPGPATAGPIVAAEPVPPTAPVLVALPNHFHRGVRMSQKFSLVDVDGSTARPTTDEIAAYASGLTTASEGRVGPAAYVGAQRLPPGRLGRRRHLRAPLHPVTWRPALRGSRPAIRTVWPASPASDLRRAGAVEESRSRRPGGK